MESADGQIHPAFVYADDGVLNLSDGIEAGAGYAARAWGAGSPIQRLTPEGNIEFGEFRIAKIEGRIRRMFFVDFPETGRQDASHGGTVDGRDDPGKTPDRDAGPRVLEGRAGGDLQSATSSCWRNADRLSRSRSMAGSSRSSPMTPPSRPRNTRKCRSQAGSWISHARTSRRPSR